MARISIVTPAGAGTRSGNRHTAQRWAALARALGHRVALGTEWDGRACDLLIALHARRSHASVERYRAAQPRTPLVVALTGTDLYRDLPASAEARRSLELADRLVVLQDEALRALAAPLRAKTRVIYQSTDTALRAAPPRARFRVLVSGHLREEKDPFRAAAALAQLREPAGLELVQLGAALSEEMQARAEAWAQREPRYRWLGARSHPRALAWIARSHLLVVSSAMEGGANVIAEAARIGTPVLASRIAGNLGMLGRGYPGYFPFGGERALAKLIARAAREPAFYARLKRALRARRPLFAPAAERRALAALLGELLPRYGIFASMPAIISISELSKTYATGFRALKSVNLEIRRGEIFALLGPNGAGKTTLIGAVCGLVRPSAGTILVDGHDIATEYRATRSLIGLVPQELTTDAFESPWGAVSFSRGLFGKPPNPAHIEKVLRELSLWDKKDAKIITLSGGMKRRLMIAKALSHEPRVLFLDEPSAGVDVELRHDMWQLVRALREGGVTIILTTHYIEEAEDMADRIGVINKGEIILVEDKAELMHKLGRKQLALQLQSPLERIPPLLARYKLELAADGCEMIYTYDAQADRAGIAALLRDLAGSGIAFKDLHTTQSSLEDIFVDLVSDRQ